MFVCVHFEISLSQIKMSIYTLIIEHGKENVGL
jgi:hypothetical protein